MSLSFCKKKNFGVNTVFNKKINEQLLQALARYSLNEPARRFGDFGFTDNTQFFFKFAFFFFVIFLQFLEREKRYKI